MLSEPFRRALTATGFLLTSGEPVPGMTLRGTPAPSRLKSVLDDANVGLNAEAVFSAHASPAIIFKDSGNKTPSLSEIAKWREAAWNFGLAPLLWVVTPTEVRLYNNYAAPSWQTRSVAPQTTLDSFALDVSDALRRLNETCGWLATETGTFWSTDLGSSIDRNTRVDRQLLLELQALEEELSSLPAAAESPRQFSQRLIGRCIFAWYLVDRKLADRLFPSTLPLDLSRLFSTRQHALKLFTWLRETFNGDLFPIDDIEAETAALSSAHLRLLRDFIDGTSLVDERRGQRRLFRFRFDAIPVELISSIYEQFARTHETVDATRQSLHYTPVELVNFVLDPVFQNLDASARVVDPACGSGVFLVESFRRLVSKRSGNVRATRQVVREVLYNQLFGVDINSTALRIAAFSLYLAALELDDNPLDDPSQIRFERLIGRTLFAFDALGEWPKEVADIRFDAVVGNPPWKYDSASHKKRARSPLHPRARRSPDQDFIYLANHLSAGSGQIGLVVKSSPFFSRSEDALESRREILKRCAPVALINLSQLRKEGLFSGVIGPAALFFSRCGLMESSDRVLVGSIPWTPTFSRSGVFSIGQGDLRSISLQRVLQTDGYLKAATFGTERDAWLIKRLADENDLVSFDELLNGAGIRTGVSRGQGFQIQSTTGVKPPMSYYKLPVLTPEQYTPVHIDTRPLDRFDKKTLHRARGPGIFRAPLLVCPKGSAKRATEPGRYSAATIEVDCLYTENFYGISFSEGDALWPLILCGILNSSMTSFQLAYGGAGWGLERSTVEPLDLLELRMPRLGNVNSSQITKLVEIVRMYGEHPELALLNALDDTVFGLYDLEGQERTIVKESVARARPLLFGSTVEFSSVASPPDQRILMSYADEVTAAVNAYLRTRGVRHIEAAVYPVRPTMRGLLEGTNLIAVRFSMAAGAPTESATVHLGDWEDVAGLIRAIQDNMRTDLPPYLQERRQLRIYEPNALFVVKPAERRYWTRTAALNDADAVLADHWLMSANEQRI